METYILSAIGESKKLVASVQQKAGGPGRPMMEVTVWGQEKVDIPAQREREFTLYLPFCSIEVLSGFDDELIFFTQSTDSVGLKQIKSQIFLQQNGFI